ESLMVERGEAERLDELPLDDRRAHLHQGLTGEDDGAFGYRVHVAAEAERRQVVPEADAHVGEDRQRAQVVDAPAVEADGDEILDRLLEAGQEEEAPIRRQAADEQLEGS